MHLRENVNPGTSGPDKTHKISILFVDICRGQIMDDSISGGFGLMYDRDPPTTATATTTHPPPI